MAEYRVDGLSRGSGLIIQGLGGQAVPRYSVVYLSGNNLWSLADASVAATATAVGLSVEPLSVNQLGRILLQGVVNNNAWAWTPGAELYVSDVAGVMAQAAGTVSIQVATAITATEILFDPHGILNHGSAVHDDTVLSFTGSNVKIADISHADVLQHTVDISAFVPVNCVAVIINAVRQAGAGVLFIYPNEGTDLFESFNRQHVATVAIANQRVLYAQNNAGDDFDMFMFGYFTEG